MTPEVTVADVVRVLEAAYPPALAEPWDAVGLVCGDPATAVGRVLLAVDPVRATADEAIAGGYRMLVTHHPLWLRGVTSVAATTAKGRRVHDLVRAGVALYAAHTNADRAAPGVSDALAETVGVRDLRPLVAAEGEPADKIVTFVPAEAVAAVVDALSAAGAGRIGGYERCAFQAAGTGTFRPGPGTAPTIGQPGRVERVPEVRVEMVLPRHARAEVACALRAAHPYEEPAYDIVPVVTVDAGRGLGRVGRLAEPVPLARFAAQVAASLPATPSGVRVSGDPGRIVRTVAVCGGSGADLAGAARAAGADVLVTADTRHHPTSENAEDGGVALVDPGHWASEWPWLPAAARRLVDGVRASGGSVGADVSTRVTDPWTVQLPSPGKERAGPP